MQQKQKRIPSLFSALFFACALFFSPILPQPAAAEARPPVRVGYSAVGSMLTQDADGKYRGYDVMYLYEIARYTGWTYEFIPYENWAQAVEDVASGKIDLLPTVLKTPAREQQMFFSLYPMAQTKIAVIKRPDDTRYVYGSYFGFEKARVGVRADTADTRTFERWLEKSGLTCIEVPYANREELLAALANGDVDLVATAYVGDVRAFPAIQEFSPQAMYFAVSPSRPDLSVALDRAMEQSFLYNPDFVSDITVLTQPDTSHAGFLLSDEERVYLSSLPTLRVAFLENNAPISYLQDGKMRGIGVHILERVSDLTGLSFELVPITDRAAAIEDIRLGKLDMLGSTFLDILRAHDEGLRITTPYYSGSAALLERHGRKDPRIGVGRSTIAYLPPERRSDPNLVVYPYITNIMQDFVRGDIDAAYCDTATASYYMAALGRGNVSLQVLPSSPIQIGMATSETADPRLTFVLDRVLEYLNTSESSEIVQQEASAAPLTLGTLLDRLTANQMNGLVLGLLLLVIGAGYLAFMIYRQKSIEQRAREIARQQESMSADLAWEKKVSAAQMGFYRYIDANMIAPIQDAVRVLTEKGAAHEGSPFHAEYVRNWQLLEFLFEVRTLNALTQDDPGVLVRERHARYYQPDPDWQPTPCRTYLEEQAAIAKKSAERKGITLAVDFSGVLDTPVLFERRGISMVLMRLFGFLMKRTRKHGVLQFAAALSRMAAENGISLAEKQESRAENTPNASYHGETHGEADRVVLWLFFNAPQLHLEKRMVAGIETMREAVRENPRAIYESLLQAQQASMDASVGILRLAILQLIIPGLGGTWEIHSTEEKGTEITIEFLLDVADSPMPMSKQSPRS